MITLRSLGKQFFFTPMRFSFWYWNLSSKIEIYGRLTIQERMLRTDTFKTESMRTAVNSLCQKYARGEMYRKQKAFVITAFLMLVHIGLAFGQNQSSDSLFTQPYIDVDEWRNEPVRHRYVHGGFKGTQTRFSFYFPPKENYEGRFFQYITPVPDSENLSQGATGEEDKISFSIQNGAYFLF